MQTFTLWLERWWVVRAFGRNPLVRLSDRTEAVLVLLAFVVSIMAAPIAGAVGTAVHETRSRAYAEQAQTRHQVTATALEDSTVDKVRYSVNARWRADATEHTGTHTWEHNVKAGDLIDIWVNNDGTWVSAPTPTSHAGLDAVLAGMTIWLSVVAVAVALVALVRHRLIYLRDAGWDRELRSLVDKDGGRTNRQW